MAMVIDYYAREGGRPLDKANLAPRIGIESSAHSGMTTKAGTARMEGMVGADFPKFIIYMVTSSQSCPLAVASFPGLLCLALSY
jgi:hypothetical protein